MNTELCTFDFESHAMRSVMIEGEPWFVGKDVCRCLDIEKHHQALERLDKDERGTYSVGTPSGNQNMTCVSEPGLYRLIFTSRKEEAERFKRWLAHDVLPTIRRTGRYEAAPEKTNRGGDYDLDDMLKALAAVRQTRLLHGKRAAKALWKRLDELPPVEMLLRGNDSPVARFLGEACETDPQARIKSDVFYRHYTQWCASTGQKPDSLTRFGRQLSRLGVNKQASNGKIYRLGWRLKG